MRIVPSAFNAARPSRTASQITGLGWHHRAAMPEEGFSASSSGLMLPPSAARALRLAFGVLFLWLGVLEIVPGMSPAEDLMRAALPAFLPIDAFIRFARSGKSWSGSASSPVASGGPSS